MSSAEDRLQACDSYERARHLSIEMHRERSSLAKLIVLFLEWGNMCDAPWACRSVVARLLREALKTVPLADALPPAALPPMIPIFRDCKSDRVYGLSWTTQIAVAEDFAAGKSYAKVNPTLVGAFIPKQHLFAVVLGRQESELAVDFVRLRQVVIRNRPDLHYC
jgi:hypothetical protein